MDELFGYLPCGIIAAIVVCGTFSGIVVAARSFFAVLQEAHEQVPR